MTLLGLDTASPQAGIDYTLARSKGYIASPYVKVGGDNVPRYIAPHYTEQVDAARRAGYAGVGHYWVPSSAKDATDAADYMVDHLRDFDRQHDFIVLDNEDLDGASRYGDLAAATFLSRVGQKLNIGGPQLKAYLGLAVARSNTWNNLVATGCDFIIAAYGYQPFGYDLAGKLPVNRNGGHQFSSSSFIGSVKVDVDAWQEWAFAYPIVEPAILPAIAPQVIPPSPIVPAGIVHSGATWNFWLPSSDLQLRIQRDLSRRSRYSGKLDGAWGTLSIEGIQTTIRNVGYTGAIDGVPGPETCHFVQLYAQKFGSYGGPIDGLLGPVSWTCFAVGLERP